MKSEPFVFTWPGKEAAAALARVPSPYRLAPDEGESIAFASAANLFIEGDNLEALRILARDYGGAVRMIYIDPPYNTGKAFIYSDSFAAPRRSMGPAVGSDGAALRHSAWLSMMLPRLILARELLSDDGVLFVSIDDGEVHHLRMLLDEVFGADAFVANIVWQKKYTRSNDARWFSKNHDYILAYARRKDCLKLNLQPRNKTQLAAYSNPDGHPKGPWKATPIHAKSGRSEPFSYRFRNGVCWSPPPGTYPRFSQATLRRLEENNEIWFGATGAGAPCRKTFLCDVKSGVTPVTLWLHGEAGHNHEANNELKALLGGGAFDNPKPTRLIRRLLELATGPDSLILDFFAGSCTTADAVFQLNRADGGHRRFIMVQEPHPTQRPGFATIAEIGKERLRRLIARMGPAEGEDLGFRVMKLADGNGERVRM